MLKKISGYTTKFLFYVRNNFLSFLFKSSVFLTLLALIYLVCILKQSNSAQKNPKIEVQQIARSQKLILRIPSKTESPPTTTEMPTTVNNFIPKVGINIGSRPFFPIQEQTTSSIIPCDTTSLLPIQQQMTSSVELTQTNPLEDHTTPGMIFIELPTSLPTPKEATTSMESIEEHPIFRFDEQTTTPISSDKNVSPPASEEPTSSINPIERSLFSLPDRPSVTLMSQELFSSVPSFEQTTPLIDSIQTHPFFPIQEQTTPRFEEIGIYPLVSIPAQDLLNLDTTESIATIPSPSSQEQTTPSTGLEETTEACHEQEISTKPTETTKTDAVAPFKRSLTLNELRLFGTKVPETTTTLTDEEEDEEGSLTDSTTNSYHESDESITELPEIIDVFGTAPGGHETDSLLPKDKSSETLADPRPSDSLFQDDEADFNALETPTIETEIEDVENPESVEVANTRNSNEDRMPSLNANPFDFQNNLFNLFNFDHLPATSNIKPNRWSNSDKVSSQQQLNAISPITGSADEVNVSPRFLQRLNRYQELDSLLNMRIKDSVSLLQRFFGNLLT